MHSLSETVFVFDLDDTLFSERQYELSGITAVWNKLNGFWPEIKVHLSLESLHNSRTQWVELILKIEPENYIFNRELLLEIYRNHLPVIELYKDSAQLLSFLVENNAKLALITDGRSTSQRNKLRALGIEHLFDPIIISEETGYVKPNLECYKLVEERYPGNRYVYIGDNPKKDFVTPNQRGWYTYGLKDRGYNVHSQSIKLADASFLPQQWINVLSEIIFKIDRD